MIPVRVTRPLWYEGKIRAVGDIVEMKDGAAHEALASKRGERVDPAPAKGAMTTETAPAAVSGKESTQSESESEPGDAGGADPGAAGADEDGKKKPSKSKAK